MKKQAILSLFVLLLAAVPLSAQKGGFQVVVNSSNPNSSISKARLAGLFLKTTTTWNNGQQVKPVDQAAKSTVRHAFSQQILGKKVPGVRGYWQRLIFSGRDTPPPEVGSDLEVLDFVRRNSGAIGYVSSGTSWGSGVKALRVEN